MYQDKPRVNLLNKEALQNQRQIGISDCYLQGICLQIMSYYKDFHSNDPAFHRQEQKGSGNTM